VRFDRYGGVDVLDVRHVPDPHPGRGQVVVAVRAAGTNPGEAAIREGRMDAVAPSQFPSGQGSDLAGVITAIGDGVTQWAVGDEVLGWSWDRSSQAELVAVPADQLIRKPAGLPWEVAGALYVAGVTAWAAVRAVDARSGHVVAVSSAAGGVGSVVTQLLRVRGAAVVGIASEANHDWLRSVGAIPVVYGDGLADRLRAAAPFGLDAFVDTHGQGYVQLAVDLGIPKDRIETIIDFDTAQRLGTKAEGSVDATSTDVLAEMTDLVASGRITVPIAATYRLERVRDAYADLEQRHTRGKIVLVPAAVSA
jgi:NADPH:quinone reductase-like Zn-dependent oxidoreductase